MKQNLRSRFRTKEDTDSIKAIVNELKLANKNHHKIYILNVIIIFLTIALFAIAYFTYYDDKSKSADEKRQRKIDFTEKQVDRFKTEILNDSVLMFFFHNYDFDPYNEMRSVPINKYRVSINKYLTFFDDLNFYYKKELIDTDIVKIYFIWYIFRFNSNRFLHDYINLIREGRYQRFHDSLRAGSYFDAIYIWARRLNINIDDSINLKWEKYYFVDELPGEYYTIKYQGH